MYLQLNNQQVYYQKVGRGKDLIMLHGWGQDSSTFWGLVNLLKEDFTLWLIDLPGHGRSETPKTSFNVSDYADIISGFIKDLKINKPILLGHSVGGNIAIKVAAENPHILDKLILESSSGIRPQKTFTRTLIYPMAKIFHYFFPPWFGFKEKIRHKFYWKLEADYINAGEMKNTLTNILDEDLTAELKKIKTETLLIWGEKDKAVPLKYGKQMYRAIPNSRIEVIDNIGHFPHLENPERFVYYVKDFS